METMLAAYLPGTSAVDLRRVPVPRPGIGQVLLRVRASGICGSDIHYIYHRHRGLGDSPTPHYRGVVAGHEPCGAIVELGAGCRHFRVGDRVVVYHISGCGFCEHCRRGFPISCTDPTVAAYGWQRDGGHAEFLVAEEKDLVHLPDALSFEDGCFVSCGVGTAYEGILRGNVSGSDVVLVVGLGPVGLAMAMLAKGRGAKFVVGVDAQSERVAVARSLGLVRHGFAAGADALAAVNEATRGGATVSYDCSGHPQGRLLALQGTRTWGRCVYIGETGTVQFDVSEDLMHRQRTLIGSWVTSLHHMEQCCADLADWNMHPHTIITDRFPLDRAADAYALAAAGRGGKVVILPHD
jgi:threonine dehydrogenase-like Zn-dependent dehydrogenase